MGYHTVIISVLMSKLKAARFFGDLKSKVKVIKEVKVTQKNENCGKFAETCGELKISFSKFPYKFDIFSGLSHFVVGEHWCRGVMYLHASRYFLSETSAKNTCSSHSSCGNQVALLSQK